MKFECNIEYSMKFSQDEGWELLMILRDHMRQNPDNHNIDHLVRWESELSNKLDWLKDPFG